MHLCITSPQCVVLFLHQFYCIQPRHEMYFKRPHIFNTLWTGRHFSGFWLLDVADREPLMWLLRHALFQSTIHCSGASLLLTIGPKCFV
jgi:hypothetical protein